MNVTGIRWNTSPVAVPGRTHLLLRGQPASPVSIVARCGMRPTLRHLDSLEILPGLGAEDITCLCCRHALN